MLCRLKRHILSVLLFAVAATSTQAGLKYVGCLYKNELLTPLLGANFCVVSIDGREVYISCSRLSGISWFDRNMVTGDLTYKGLCQQGGSITGLSAISSGMLSPDGKQLYVTGVSENAVTWLSRDSVTGALQPSGTLKNLQNGMNNCVGPQSVAISPDGHEVFVVSSDKSYYSPSAIHWFARNISTGALTYKSNIVMDSTNGLRHVLFVTVTPDGKQVYTVSGGMPDYPDYIDNAVSWFDRDYQTGILTFRGCIRPGKNGVDSLGNWVNSALISPDGKTVYVSAGNGLGSDVYNTINWFYRDTITGNLTYKGRVRQGQNGIDSLITPGPMALSLDHKQVYVIASGSSALNWFDRDSVSGALTFKGCYTNVAGYSGSGCAAESPDGKNVYVTAFGDSGISWYDRNISTGSLVYKSFLKDFKIDGLAIPTSLTISPNGKNVYVVSQSDGALCWFKRDTMLGSLAYVSSLKQGKDGVTGLDAPASVQISKDGKQLYSTGGYDGDPPDSQRVGSFEINASTGEPSFGRVVSHTNGCTNYSLSISPDGKHLYIAAKPLFGDSSMILRYNRDTATGVISYVESTRNNPNGGCAGEAFVTLSPDGKQVYTCASSDHAVCWFDRNAGNGTLSYQGSYQRPKNGADSLFDPICLSLSPDGKQCYVASNGDNAVAWFDRDLSSGNLTYRGYAQNGKNGVIGIGGILYIVTSPDGKAVYTTSVGDDAISWFNRDVASGSITYQGCIKSTDEGVAGLHYGNCEVISPDSKNVYVTSKSDAISWYIVTDDATVVSYPRQYVARRPCFSVTRRSISITLPEETKVLCLKVFDIKGGVVSKIVARNLSSGKHLFPMDKTRLHPGSYICEISTDQSNSYSISAILH
jgi:6-phosphogluconolactonase (cycloisomerase 2 family)